MIAQMIDPSHVRVEATRGEERHKMAFTPAAQIYSR
jgi:hypothetical protein